MTLPIQTCSLCLISIEMNASTGYLEGRVVTSGKSLSCGHIFHAECINKWIWDGGSNCPSLICKKTLSEEERTFKFTKDPVDSKEREVFYSMDERGKSKAVFAKNFPENTKKFILENYHRLPEMSFLISEWHGTFSIDPDLIPCILYGTDTGTFHKEL